MTHLETLQLHEGYYRVREEMDELYRLLNGHGRRPHPAELSQRVQRLRDSLSNHFYLLDQDGYLFEVEELVPQLHDRLNRLHLEQEALLEALASLEDDLQQVSATAVDFLFPRIATLLARIQNHEIRQNRLVQDAFYIDPSALD